MRLLYSFGIQLYGIAIRLASLFNPKAKKWLVGRKNWNEKLPTLNSKNVIWFHCASLGEFDQGLPLMEKIKTNDPDCFLLVTFFSPSGFEHYHKREHTADYVCYLPLDTRKNAKKFIQHFAPAQTFFVKYEFWGNYILEAKKHGSKLHTISGLFRSNQRFFKWYGRFFRTVLTQFDHFFVQNEASKTLLASIGLENVTVTGDSRFDRVIENRNRANTNELLEVFKGDNPLVIIGSSWPADEAILFPWINRTEHKIVIAAHQIDEKHLCQIEAGISRKTERYSRMTSDTKFDFDVLILDTIGQLASVYKYGTIAYIGGGFSGNLHNILEPAVFGLPVIFGPKHNRFPEAQAFIDGGFGFSVETTQQFEMAFDKIVTDRDSIGERERAFVEANAGASEKIYSAIY